MSDWKRQDEIVRRLSKGYKILSPEALDLIEAVEAGASEEQLEAANGILNGRCRVEWSGGRGRIVTGYFIKREKQTRDRRGSDGREV